jgi:hypothetical protein
MALKFFAQRGAAGQFLAAVDRHGTGSAYGGTAGVAECQAPVTLLLDTNERVEDSTSTPDVEPELLWMRCGIDFGIESLNREGKAHRENRLPTMSIQPSISRMLQTES